MTSLMLDSIEATTRVVGVTTPHPAFGHLLPVEGRRNATIARWGFSAHLRVSSIHVVSRTDNDRHAPYNRAYEEPPCYRDGHCGRGHWTKSGRGGGLLHRAQ